MSLKIEYIRPSFGVLIPQIHWMNMFYWILYGILPNIGKSIEIRFEF